MTEENKIGRVPDYKGDGVAVWINKDKNGKQYLGIKVLGSINVNAFKNDPQKQVEQQIIKEAGITEEKVNELL